MNREELEEYSSIDEINNTMASSKRTPEPPPPIPGSNCTHGQNEYLNPSYRSHPQTYHKQKNEDSGKRLWKADWWVWILMGLSMVIIIMLILVLVFTLYDNCKTTSEANSSSNTGSGSMPTESCGAPALRHVNFSCAEHMLAGFKSSGVYTIFPSPDTPVEVYCDMDTNAGGWTVIQKRLDGSVNFNEGWSEYLKGFGSVEGEYWLGLENIHLLTHGDRMSLYVHLADWENDTRYSEYDFFYVTPSADSFRLLVSDYTGNAGDGMRVYLSRTFATKDHGSACSSRTRSAWWFSSCLSNLNGVYIKGQLNASQVGGVVWPPWRGIKYSLKTVTLMIRPSDFLYRIISCRAS